MSLVNEQNSVGVEKFVSLHLAARRVGIPIAWLRAEAEANRVPHLKAGRRLLFNLEALSQSLIARAEVTKEAASA